MGLRGPGAKPVRKKKRAAKPRTAKAAKVANPSYASSSPRVRALIYFIESLPITSGKFAGQKFRLRPWQVEILEGIYGPERDGKRIVRRALLSFPRKNGKTGLAAALALAHFCGPEAEPRGQVFSAAADREQAALIFNEMKAMLALTPKLRDRVIVRDFNKHMEDVDTGSIYKALSADSNTKHGFSASCIIYDELAQARDRKLYDTLTTSTGARSQPLIIVISTQNGDPLHIMSELVDEGIQIRDGIVEDESFYPCIYSAPMDADPWDEETWAACNPALGDFRDLEEMRISARQAQRIPAREATFRLLYLNQRVSAEARFVARADWDACGRAPSDEFLKAKTCYGALDLSGSGKNDLLSFVLLFPLEDGQKAIRSFFWACESGLEGAEARDRAPYRLWAREGHLITIPKRVIDYGYIAQKIKEVSAKYELRVVAFDPWKIEHFIQAADDAGVDLTMQPHGQGFKDMDPSISALEDDILAWRLLHDNNPIMNWCLDNVMVERDSAGNRKFSKRKSTGRIDGAVALAMAEGIAMKQRETEPQFFVL